VAQRLAQCTDAVVAVDDGSTDETPDILASLPNLVRLFRNPPGGVWDAERDMANLMREVHRLRPEWVLYINSDDLLDARFAAQRRDLLGVGGVGRYHFQEVTLWGSTEQHRVDRPEWFGRARGTTPYLVRYAPGLRFVNGYHRNPRRRLVRALRNHWATGLVRRSVRKPAGTASTLWPRALREVLWPTDHLDWTNQVFEGWEGREELLDLVRVHYHWADPEHAVRKHMVQAVSSAIRQQRAAWEVDEIVDWAMAKLSTEGMQLAQVDPAWGVAPLRRASG
jgi:glycosyltransferase involved in cell wall biosynthesis